MSYQNSLLYDSCDETRLYFFSKTQPDPTLLDDIFTEPADPGIPDFTHNTVQNLDEITIREDDVIPLVPVRIPKRPQSSLTTFSLTCPVFFVPTFFFTKTVGGAAGLVSTVVAARLGSRLEGLDQWKFIVSSTSLLIILPWFFYRYLSMHVESTLLSRSCVFYFNFHKTKILISISQFPR